MVARLESPEIVAFGPFVLDVAGERLLLDGKPVRLRRKARQVIAYLFSNRGRVVPTEELLDTVWPGLAVTPHSLTEVISTLRRVLALDDSKACRIETEHRVGYRLVIEDRLADRASEHHAEDRPVTRVSSHACVARDAEIEDLGNLWQRALGGQLQIVLLSGDVGVGKSTLVHELADRVRNEAEAIVLVGRCRGQHGDPEPFQPLFQLFEALESRLGGTTVAELLRRFAPAWLVQFPWLTSPDEVEQLRRLLGGSQSGRLLREASRLMREVSRQNPLLLILEDLHWADPGTLDFVRTIAEDDDRSRVFVMGTYRVVEAAIGTSAVVGLREALRSAASARFRVVEPWGPARIAEYLAVRFATRFSESSIAALERQTRGNPLLLSGLLDGLIRDGWLRQCDGKWSLSGAPDLATLRMPDAIQSLIGEQFRQLRAEDRGVLEAAAVLGGEFYAAEVAALCDAPVEDVAERLAELSDRRSFVTPTSFVKERGDFAFLHACHHQEVLDQLPVARLRDLGLRAADASAKAENHPGCAADLARKLEAGGAWKKAADQWEQAASRAFQCYAYREAASFVRHAVDAIERLAPSRDRDLRLASHELEYANLTTLFEEYTSPRAQAAFARCRELATARNEGLLVFRATAGEALVSMFSRDYAAAAEHTAALRDYARIHPEVSSMMHSYCGYLAFAEGRFADCLREAEAGLRTIDRALPGIPTLQHLATNLELMRTCAVSIVKSRSEWRDAAQGLLDTMPVSSFQDARTGLLLARSALWMEEDQLAIEWAELARGIAITAAMSDWSDLSSTCLVAARCRLGHVPIHELAEVVEQRKRHPDGWDNDIFLKVLADQQRERGDFEAASHSLAQAFDSRDEIWTAELWRSLGDLVVASEAAGHDLYHDPLRQGPLSERPDAARCYQRAMEIARHQQATLFFDRASSALAQLNGSKGGDEP